VASPDFHNHYKRTASLRAMDTAAIARFSASPSDVLPPLRLPAHGHMRRLFQNRGEHRKVYPNSPELNDSHYWESGANRAAA